MRRLVLAGASVVLVAGCGSAAQTVRNPQSPDDGASPRLVHRIRIGHVVTLTGPGTPGRAALRLAVLVKRVVSPARGRGAFEQPRKGERFVAVGFVLKNVGRTTYADSPTYGANVVDDTGQGYDPMVVTVSTGPGFPSRLLLRRGQVKAGYIVFAVPKDARITNVRYALNAVGDAAEWRLS